VVELGDHLVEEVYQVGAGPGAGSVGRYQELKYGTKQGYVM